MQRSSIIHVREIPSGVYLYTITVGPSRTWWTFHNADMNIQYVYDSECEIHYCIDGEEVHLINPWVSVELGSTTDLITACLLAIRIEKDQDGFEQLIMEFEGNRSLIFEIAQDDRNESVTAQKIGWS